MSFDPESSVSVTSTLGCYFVCMTYICRWHGELCSLTVISKSLPDPVQWSPHQNHGCYFIQCYLRAWMPQAYKIKYCPPSLRTEISLDFQLFIVVAILRWGTLFWNYRWTLFQIIAFYLLPFNIISFKMFLPLLLLPYFFLFHLSYLWHMLLPSN